MALVEGCKHELEITVPVVEVERETERVVAELAGKVRLPGFRPGKAPATLVKSRFASDIRQDVLEKLVPRFFNAAVEKENLQLVGRPNVTDVHFHPGEPLRFKAEFEVAPAVELGDYRGLPVTYREPEATDSDVEQRLEQLREQKAEYVNEEPRPLADGDYAVVALESLAGGYIDRDRIECPRHGASFSVVTGEAVTPPATLPLPTFTVEVRDGRVLLDPTPSHPHPLIRS